MRVQYLPANIDGQGCYRCIFPAAYLSDRGHVAGIPGFTLHRGDHQPVPPLPGKGLSSVPPGDFYVSYHGETIDWDADVTVVQMGTFRWQHEWLDKIKGKLVVDLDDDVRRIPSYNPAKMDASNLDSNRRYAEEALERADAVTVSTPELARLYSRWNTNITVVPNYLHWPMWAGLDPVYERREWSRFRVGYMGNMNFHSEDVKSIAKSLRLWLMRNPEVEFVACGDPRIHDIVGTPGGQRVTTAKVWFRCLDLPYITSSFDVGLVPLVSNAFNEGKSHLKGLEYSACGIVPLVSPTEPYRGFVSDGETGFLCERPIDFTARLDELLADFALRERVGCAARAKAREHSLDRHIQEWESVFERICDGYHADRAWEGIAA